MKNKKGQVWVETVIYTLIGLILIGTVLAFATPTIQKQRDKSILEGSLSTLNELDNSIASIKGLGVSNAREVFISMSEGQLIIDGENDQIVFEFDENSYVFSEIRTTVNISGTNVQSRTIPNGDKYTTILTLGFNGNANITYENKDKKQTLGSSPNPYKLILENLGKIPDLNSSCTLDVECGQYECSGGLCRPKYININIYDAS